jgi:MFS family permease
MALSIFTYAVFTGLCGFATEAWHIAALRFVASLGMGGEWSLGVALVNEIWPNQVARAARRPDRRRRESRIPDGRPPEHRPPQLHRRCRIGPARYRHADGDGEQAARELGWRFLMISGALPALLVFFIRLFVPESRKWEHEKARGATSHWSNGDLLGVTTGAWRPSRLSGAGRPRAQGRARRPSSRSPASPPRYGDFCSGAALSDARDRRRFARARTRKRIVIKHMLLGAGLAGVALLGTWGSIQWAPRWAFQLEPDPSRFSREYTQIASALGAILFPILAGVVAGKFGRRNHIRRAVRGIDPVVSPAVPRQRPV